MNNPIYSFSDLFLNFIFLCGFYAVPVGAVFLLAKWFSKKEPSPYTGQVYFLLCMPAILYGVLESISPRQGLNILLVVPGLILAGILALLFMSKFPLRYFVYAGCALVVLLYIVVPNGVLRLF